MAKTQKPATLLKNANTDGEKTEFGYATFEDAEEEKNTNQIQKNRLFCLETFDFFQHLMNVERLAIYTVKAQIIMSTY